MTINGIANNDIYYMNNPLMMELLDVNVNSAYLVITIQNLGDNSSTQFKTHARNGRVLFDLAPAVRMLSQLPNGNAVVTSFSVSVDGYNLNDIQVETSSFNLRAIRGGVMANVVNQSPVSGKVLSASNKVPFWPGYYFAFDYLNIVGNVSRISFVPTESYHDSAHNVDIVQMMTKKGNPEGNKYFKYLNANGGYSYWLFEESETQTKSKHIGYYRQPSVSGVKLNDMGHTIEVTSSATTTINAEWITHLAPITYSSDVYLLEGMEWKKVIVSDNNVKYNANKKTYEVSINHFENNTYTPTTLI